MTSLSNYKSMALLPSASLPYTGCEGSFIEHSIKYMRKEKLNISLGILVGSF